ncbi:MAG: Stk1 family PASTA domain-containing Ser/Thr kinase, partial [Lachnospiraceae bacterium]|nr:Stk1 family PASTA domain-containing Ser/Thr kinase [Lachnospiraceae bacterium]
MIKIGMVVGERYEILEKIGMGGMSDVYKAKDHKLNRFVAVKVLKQEFSENANFVSKFRIEAQAAAGLMHPNIVNVYDVGEENGIYYIVMELVEGITLKKYIEKKARLSVKEAISIAIQVCMGIEAAHNNHIIHRDIKPQNIIISKEGKVKVTDFGIAKAATSNTITSNVMGSVHYTSPEQARGGYSDEKSDVYSLGITMFEMLTGRVPFNGETTVAIAIKHIQEEMLSPREYVSEIPVSVEQIVFKCCQKSPDRRYQSMGELIVDLKKSLMNPDEDFVKVADPDEEGATRAITENDMAQIKRVSDRRDSMEKAMHLRTDKEVKKKAKKRYIEEDDDGFDPKMERLTTALAIAAAVIIGCIVLFLVGRAFGLFEFAVSGKDREDKQETPVEETVLMIRVVGKKLDTVKVELLSIGLTPEIEYQESTQYQEGVVMESSVKEGTLVPLGSNVILTVSSGSEGVEVPDVVGLTEAEAVSGLEQKGFVVTKTEAYDQFIKEGSIVTQVPEAQEKVPAGTTVTICISKGPENTKVRVPDLIGKDEMEAMSLLVEAGLQMGAVTEVNHEDANLAGRVCYQSYSVGAYVEKDTVVDVQVSLGPVLATYKFQGDITAPTPEEDPAYKPGTPVNVTLMADDGTMLLSTQTTSFPIPQQNITGIPINTGYILYQYT